MPATRVFVSSTYYDLRHVRALIEEFIRGHGFEPVLFERGTIAYDPGRPLIESGFRELESCQILVLVIGTYYGTTTNTKVRTKSKTSGVITSVTMEEYRTALSLELPVYAFVDSAAWNEYQVYNRNRELKDIKFAHIEEQGVFEFLDFIMEQNRNNALFTFYEATDIIRILRKQWSGLFYELLIQARENAHMRAVQDALNDLRDVAARLEAYAERIVLDVSKKGAESLIEDQKRATSDRRLERYFDDFRNSAMGRFVSRFRKFESAEAWSTFLLEHQDLESFLVAIGTPRSEIEYVISRAISAIAFRSAVSDLMKLRDKPGD